MFDDLELPHCVHPVRFVIRGVTYEVISYGPISDDEAARYARAKAASFGRRPPPAGSLVRVITVAGS